MKKILVIITTEFVSFGGLTTVMMNYYRAIDKNKYRVDFASTNNKLDENLRQEINANGSNYYWLGDRKHNTFCYIRKLYSLLKDSDYQVVHVNANSATAAIELFTAKIVGVPIRIAHNHTSICDHKAFHKMLYPLFISSYTDAIACSDKAGKWIFNNNDFVVLNNGIDTQKFIFCEEKRSAIRQKFNIDNDILVFGHVGKIYKPKNHEFLLHVFSDYTKYNDKCKLLLVGDGELRSNIEKLAKELKIDNNMIFVGMQTDIASYLSAMDIFLFPSLWEGLPLSLVEAQASGLRCIASDTIDSSVNVTKKVTMLPITEGTKVWVDSMKNVQKIDRKTASFEQVQLLIDGGFDAKVNVEKLEAIYK